MAEDAGVLKNFRVTCVEISTITRTVVATSPAEAIQEVEGGYGAHAGQEGPQTFATIAQDRAELAAPPTLQGVMQELRTAWQLLEAARQQMRSQQSAGPRLTP